MAILYLGPMGPPTDGFDIAADDRLKQFESLGEGVEFFRAKYGELLK